jgi:hypothetical protein
MIDFKHRQGSHCESSAAASLLAHHGWPLSEAMCFGLAAGLSFSYLPFVKIYGMPLVAYRALPGRIIARLQRRLKLPLQMQQFTSSAAGQVRLDALLAQGQPVGLQACIYWLPYIPENLRFHFNAHNLIVYGQHGDSYTVSDSVLEETHCIARDDLQRARFVRGKLAPKGRLFYFSRDVVAQDVCGQIGPAIKQVAKEMLQPVLPWIGVKGIRFLGKQLRDLDEGSARRDTARLLLHIVRMQEVIGTGGAGFRFLYAAFLQESAQCLQSEPLAKKAIELTEIGDAWRRFASELARMAKGRMPLSPQTLQETANQLAAQEARFFRALLALTAQLPGGQQQHADAKGR